MKQIGPGARYEGEVWACERDLASAYGNTGVDVVSSPATIGYLETACHHVIDPYYEDDEASVGIGFNFRHLAAAHLNAPLQLTAELIRQTEKTCTFKVEARQEGKVIMTGEHERAIINLNRFLKNRQS